jgi:hypothetical protein
MTDAGSANLLAHRLRSGDTGTSWSRSPLVVVLVILRALIPAWRIARGGSNHNLVRATVRPGPFVAAVANTGLGPAATTGIGMSLERGRSGAFRTALLGTVVAVAGIVAAL